MADAVIASDGREERPVLWASRLLRRALFDADGSTVGTIEDMTLAHAGDAGPPELRGFVARVDRRQIFVRVDRVDAVDRDGVHLRGGTVDLRRFKQRQGEILVTSEIIGSRVDGGTVTDVGFVQHEDEDDEWVAHRIAVTAGGRMRRRPPQTRPWSDIAARFRPDAMTGELARLRELHKADAAEALQLLPERRRAQVMAALEASRLADVLEELPEEDQVEFITQLATEDAVEVLEHMEVDDEIDLLQEMSSTDREALLAQMPAEEVALLRSLLSYREDTAGGLMTPQAVILGPETTVAEAVARLRESDLPPALMVRIFITEEPHVTPTGKYLGTVTLPRLLKEQPTHTVGDCIDGEVPIVKPSTPESEVAKLLARYDLLVAPVVDAANRLVGVVTVDDVLVRLIEGDDS